MREFLVILEIMRTVWAGDQAEFDGFFLAVDFCFSLPIAGMLQEQLVQFRILVYRIAGNRLFGDPIQVGPWVLLDIYAGRIDLNGNLHVDGGLHAQDKVGEGAVAGRELSYFGQWTGGIECVGHDNECLGETRYHQKRKGGAGD